MLLTVGYAEHTALQWGRACEDADSPSTLFMFSCSTGFNGAAPVRTRIAYWRRHVRLHLWMLQWGRACEDADSPPQDVWRPLVPSFNGAAPVRTRIVMGPLVPSELQRASMGPRL